jgi:hypothetical protein
MKEAVYIDRGYKAIPAADFKLLLDEGLTTIQKMAGDKWTDYNIHDPGVTILEQLCYALTELGYRANFNFEDLLASQAQTNNTPEKESDTFYTAATILHSAPVTIKDYRKGMIDRIYGLRNIWIEPLNVSKKQSQIDGVYLAFAEASPDAFNRNDKIKYESQKQELKKNIWHYITEHTNLGEAFEKVIILESIKVQIEANIELAYEADVDEVHANVMFTLGKSMTRPMAFQKLQTLIDGGKHINDIFEGPKMGIGFVDDHQLAKKVQVLYAATFLSAIRPIDGILFVQSLFISDEENPTPSHIKYININQIPMLGNVIDDTKQPIKYFKRKKPVEPNIERVEKILKALKVKDQIENNYDKSSYNDFPIPKGRKKNIGSYYSFQNHFPAIYGLGKLGLPMHMNKEKKMAVMQLKGYLMFFDQIMANYFAQLENFSGLFSLDKNVSRSYFGGTISELKDINKMVDFLGDERENDFDTFLKKIVKKALSAIDDFDDRRNRFLDHLLARFGERIANYGISNFNTYHLDKENKKRQLDIKINLLKYMVDVSKNRAQSFDYGRLYWGNDNTSSMEKKIKILLGLPPKNRFLAKQNQLEWKQYDHKRPFDFINIFSKLHASRISLVDSELFDVSTINGTVPVNDSVINAITVDHEMLLDIFKNGKLSVIELRMEGVHKHILLYNKETDESIQESYQQKLLDDVLCLFRSAENKQKMYWMPGEDENYVFEFNNIYDKLSKVWKQIGIFDTHQDAMHAGKMLFSHVRNMHMQSEGFYLVDHILLRPRSEKDVYGIHFFDEDKNVEVNSTQQFELSQLQTKTIDLAKRLSQSTSKARKNKRGKFMASMTDHGEELAYSKQKFTSETAAIQYGESIKPYFEAFNELNFYDKESVKMYKAYEKGADMNGNDYSFRVTIILPQWTLRFADTEFQRALENTFRLECPAHIGIDFKWLDLEEMVHFENIYEPWLEALRNENEKIGDLNTLSNKIMQFIKYGSQHDDMVGYLSHKDFTTG